MYVAHRIAAAEAVAAGEPFWNPLSFGGLHHLSYPPAGLLYPLNALHWFGDLDPLEAFTALSAAHVVLFAGGLFLLAREAGAGPAAAAAAGAPVGRAVRGCALVELAAIAFYLPIALPLAEMLTGAERSPGLVSATWTNGAIDPANVAALALRPAELAGWIHLRAGLAALVLVVGLLSWRR